MRKSYDDAVREAQGHLEHCFGQLSDIRTQFIEVAKTFREVESINKRYAEIIGGKLPQIDDPAFKLPDAELDDEHWFKKLAKLYDKIPDEERLVILTAAVKQVNAGLADFRRKNAKLANSLNLMDGDSGEYNAVVNKKRKVEQTVAILEKRRDGVLSRFFRFRRAMLKRISGATDIISQQFVNKTGAYDIEFREALKKGNVQELCVELAQSEQNILKQNGKY